MALIVNGLTKCAICDKVFTDEEDVLALPAVNIDRQEPSFKYNDSGIHMSCFRSNTAVQNALFENRHFEVFLENEYPELCLEYRNNI